MKNKRISNEVAYPDCWQFFIDFARNITEEEDINHLGNYRISYPDMSEEFIYAQDTPELFKKLHYEWYKIRLDSPSVYGKIQYIVQTF